MAVKPLYEGNQLYEQKDGEWVVAHEVPLFVKDLESSPQFMVEGEGRRQVVGVSQADQGGITLHLEGGRRRDDVRTVLPDTPTVVVHAEVAGLLFLAFSE